MSTDVTKENYKTVQSSPFIITSNQTLNTFNMNKILIIAAIVAVFATAAFAQQCNASSATSCANTWSTCVTSGGLDVNKICACYGPYFSCLRSANCLTDSQLTSIQQSCSQSGCTTAQCSSAVSISGVFGLFVAAVAAFF